MTDEPISLPAEGREGKASCDCPLCGALVCEEPTGGSTPGEPQASPLLFCHRCRALIPAPPQLEIGGISEVEIEAGVETDSQLDGLGESTAPARRLAWELAEHLDAPPASGPIIDLGAGRGRLLHALGELGYQVRGCESSARLCQIARATFLMGPDVLFNDEPDAYLDAVEIEGGPIAGFTMLNGFERQPDPLGLLRRCRDLAPAGMLFVRFPIAKRAVTDPRVRALATPASIVHLAQELHLQIAHLSVAEDSGLRAFLRCLPQDVVDLDAEESPTTDLDSLESAYRSISPSFARFMPGTDEDMVEEIELGTGPA